jgi:hypothetical protein
VFGEATEGQGWLSLAINYQGHPTTRYCALDCFSNIVEDYFNELFFPRVCEEIECGQTSLVW